MKRSKEKGFVLITTILISVIALAAIGAFTMYSVYSEKIYGKHKRYTTALEAAKGMADYVIRGLVSGDITLSSCTANCILTSLPSISGYDVSATVLQVAVQPTGSGDISVYAVRVNSQKASNPVEKSTIEFVLKVE